MYCMISFLMTVESSAGLLIHSGGFEGGNVPNHHSGERRPLSVGSDVNTRRRHCSSGSGDFTRLRHEHRVSNPVPGTNPTSSDGNDCFRMLRYDFVTCLHLQIVLMCLQQNK